MNIRARLVFALSARAVAPGRGPVEGCSLERFLEEDFDVVSSYVHAAYVNGWISEEYIRGWGPRRRPSVPDDRAEQVRGGELLAWEPSDEPACEYFERALPSAIPTFADCLWHPEPIRERNSSRNGSRVTRSAHTSRTTSTCTRNWRGRYCRTTGDASSHGR